MMWSDKAFSIYMGAALVTPGDAIADESSSFDLMVTRNDAQDSDPCSDGDTQRTSWLTRGTSLTDTQVHSAARG